MKITLSPIRMETPLIAEVAGDVLILNNEKFDLSGVTEKSPLVDHTIPWIIGSVSRARGVLHLTLILPHGAHPPHETLFPKPVETTAGKVPLPPFDLSPTEESGLDRPLGKG